MGSRWVPVVMGGCHQLAAVHSVVFSTQAEDADGDTLMYVIDTASVRTPGAGARGGEREAMRGWRGAGAICHR